MSSYAFFSPLPYNLKLCIPFMHRPNALDDIPRQVAVRDSMKFRDRNRLRNRGRQGDDL